MRDSPVPATRCPNLSPATDDGTQARLDSLLEIEWQGVRIRLGEVAGRALIKGIAAMRFLVWTLLILLAPGGSDRHSWRS